MKFDIGGRQTGKTSRMLQWMLSQPEDESRVIIVHSEHEAQRLRQILKNSGIEVDAWKIVRADQARNLMGRDVVLGIDNLDLILGSLFGRSVSRISATGELDDGTHI